MKLGVPVIARSNAANAQIIKHKSTGLLYTISDVRISAATINRLQSINYAADYFTAFERLIEIMFIELCVVDVPQTEEQNISMVRVS